MNDHLERKRPSPGKRISIALAIAVHVALAVFLIFGVRWQSERPEAIEVELVRPGPVAPAAEPAPPPKPEVKPEPKPQPKPEPKPEPKPAPPPPKPDIAIKEKPKPKETPPPFNPLEDLKAEKPRTNQNLQSAIEKELAQRDAAQAAAASSARSKAVAAWTDRIASKIKHNIVRPGNASGNPEAIYEITLLPDGSIVGEPRLKQGTGNPALDSAIERAIRKSDPLPKPDDPSVFSRILVLRFRPLEE
ncbi:MAG: TonB C-terminal domain-containing protein [Ignavibacteria bacterium]